MAAVLKTAVGKPTVGSNPTPSAIFATLVVAKIVEMDSNIGSIRSERTRAENDGGASRSQSHPAHRVASAIFRTDHQRSGGPF